MKKSNPFKNGPSFSELTLGLIHSIPIFAIKLSSSFFVALFILTIFASNHVFNSTIILFSFTALLVLHNMLVDRFKNYHNIFATLGSVVFLIFFFSQFFNKNIFSDAFNYYIQKVELVLNLGVLSLMLSVFLFLVVLAGAPEFLAFLRERIAQNVGVAKILLQVLHVLVKILAWSMFLVIVVGYFVKPVDAWIADLLLVLARWIKPFLGFSLLFLHSNFLVKKISQKV